jgi:cytochrome c biogenesis protein CcmG/thiol:disulfide interchange protein DsbE
MVTTTADERPLPAVRRAWWIIPALVAALAVIAILGIGMLNRDRAQVLSGPAPDFTLTTFDGQEVTLSELQGKPVIINFWASWCVECDKEMTLLEQIHQKYDGEVVMLGIAYSDVEPKARDYLAQYGITYMAGQDLGSRISDAYRIKGVPETFFIGRDGTVQGLKIGPIEQPELEGWIGQLLSE